MLIGSSRAAARVLATSRSRVQLPVCNGVACVATSGRSVEGAGPACEQRRRGRRAAAAPPASAAAPLQQPRQPWRLPAGAARLPAGPTRRLLVAARAGAQAGAAVQPDFELPVLGGGAPIAVFGVEHTERQPHIGEWVLDNRPAAVIVETACHPGHGAWPGNVFTCSDQVLGSDGGFFQRLFCQVAAAMEEQGPAARAPDGAWHQAAANLNGEQLAYVAALAVGSKLAFGDRPKEITYKRLFALPSLAQIDEAFGAEVLRQYLEVLGEGAAASGGAASDGSASKSAASDGEASKSALCVVDEIMLREREAVMCHVAAAAAAEAAAAGAGGGGGRVALVVGSAHLPGIKALWGSGEWRALAGAADLAASPLMSAPPLPPADMERPGSGARRGMLDAVLSLSVTEDVLQDLDTHLPPVPEAQEEERQLAFEFYSAQRTQLATLPRGVLDRVVSAAPGAVEGGGEGAGGRSFWGALEPLRSVRPVNGGKGWDEELVVELRALDMYISAGGGGDDEDMEEAANNAAGMA